MDYPFLSLASWLRLHIDYSFKKIDRNRGSIVKGISFYKERCHVSLLVDRGVKVVVREKETLKMLERGQ